MRVLKLTIHPENVKNSLDSLQAQKSAAFIAGRLVHDEAQKNCPIVQLFIYKLKTFKWFLTFDIQPKTYLHHQEKRPRQSDESLIRL